MVCGYLIASIASNITIIRNIVTKQKKNIFTVTLYNVNSLCISIYFQGVNFYPMHVNETANQCAVQQVKSNVKIPS